MNLTFALQNIKLRSKVSVVHENLSAFATTLTCDIELGIHKAHVNLFSACNHFFICRICAMVNPKNLSLFFLIDSASSKPESGRSKGAGKVLQKFSPCSPMIDWREITWNVEHCHFT